MANTDFKTVDEYIATFPESVQEVLGTVRATIRKAIPDADEVISYGIPTYRYHGWSFHFGGYKQHYSLFGFDSDLLEALEAELSAYVTPKGTIKIPLDEPVPVELIRNMTRQWAAGSSQEKPTRAKQA